MHSLHMAILFHSCCFKPIRGTVAWLFKLRQFLRLTKPHVLSPPRWFSPPFVHPSHHPKHAFSPAHLTPNTVAIEGASKPKCSRPHACQRLCTKFYQLCFKEDHAPSIHVVISWCRPVVWRSLQPLPRHPPLCGQFPRAQNGPHEYDAKCVELRAADRIFRSVNRGISWSAAQQAVVPMTLRHDISS